MSPYTETSSQGGFVEEDSHEQWGAGESGSHGARGQGGAEVEGCGGDAATELSASQTLMGALSTSGRKRPEAWECGAGLESQQGEEAAAAGAGADPGKIFRDGGGGLWSDLSPRP